MRSREVVLALSLLLGAACGEAPEEASPSDAAAPAPAAVPAASTSYELVGPDESVGWTTTQRYTTRIRVPPGRTRPEVEATLDRAARELLGRHTGADAAMVFAYLPGDPVDGEPTVGTAVRSQNGNWIHASSTGPMRTSFELVEAYFQAPPPAAEESAPR